MIKPLNEILPYQNKYIIKRFMADYKMSMEEADLIVEDMVRFLWLDATMSEKRATDPNVPDISIAHGMFIIDEMWHSFVLLTEMYTNFCVDNFGRYIHHPTKIEKYYRNLKTMEQEKAFEIFLTELVQCIMEYLGEDVAVRWFDEYHKYIPDNYEELVAHHR